MTIMKERGDGKAADVRPTTRDVHKSLLDDAWPSNAGVEDFGLVSTEHYGALRYAIRHHGLTVERLDDVLGDGPAITALIRDDNPYRGVVFTTAWDRIMVRIREWADVTGGKFPLGRLFVTPAALKALPRPEIAAALRRHSAGDLGDGGSEGREASVPDGEEIVSSHRSAAGQDFCISTEADRSATLVCLEGEF